MSELIRSLDASCCYPSAEDVKAVDQIYQAVQDASPGDSVQRSLLYCVFRWSCNNFNACNYRATQEIKGKIRNIKAMYIAIMKYCPK